MGTDYGAYEDHLTDRERKQYLNRETAWIVTEHDTDHSEMRFTAFSSKLTALRHALDAEQAGAANADDLTAADPAVLVRVHEVPWPNDGNGPCKEALVFAFTDWQRNVQVNVFEPVPFPDCNYGRGVEFVPKFIMVTGPEGTYKPGDGTGWVTLDGPTETGCL